MTPDYIQPFVTQTPVYDNEVARPGVTHIATHDQAKPLLKMMKFMLKPRHPKTKHFTKPPRQRKNKKQSYFS